ncbi:GNAT family N-acetyltransferase [Rhizobiaceae sp. 2RAB30]
MTAEIRPARASDANAILAIENDVFEGDRISARSMRRLLTGRSAAVFVASVTEVIAGYCVVLWREGTRVARLYSIATDRKHVGAGVGRALLDAAEAAAQQRGRRLMRLEVREDNDRARALYERNGYRFIGTMQRYYHDGTAALRYEKTLPSAGPPAETVQGDGTIR